jgi:hypothetical protein
MGENYQEYQIEAAMAQVQIAPCIAREFDFLASSGFNFTIDNQHNSLRCEMGVGIDCLT